ncbi:MAG: hypothetical protein MK165_17060 [Pirellulaceae bacterium]|nr:hypothetical protein [Pirellulaceae bacterium]
MYSESEHPWFAWSYVFALVIGGVLYAFCEWGIFEQGWRLEQMLPFVVMIFTIFAILLFLRRCSGTYFVREDGIGLEFGLTGWSVCFVYTDIIEAQPVDIRWIS